MPTAAYLRLLDHKASLVGAASLSPDDPFANIEAAEAVIAGGRLVYGEKEMTAAPNLRVISRTGIGADNVDVAVATSRGIAVCNTPDGPPTSTAEHALLLMLAVAKNLPSVQLGPGRKWAMYGECVGTELDGLTLGIVGIGRIGSRMAGYGNALGMTSIAADPFLSSHEIEARGAKPIASLKLLLGEANVVTLHVPLAPETRSMMSHDQFESMKQGAILVNTARGGLVDETALLEALDNGKLAGAGLDVFDPEPPDPQNPLLHHKNVVATAHRGGATIAARDRTQRMAIEQAFQVLSGQRPKNLVNPGVWSSAAT